MDMALQYLFVLHCGLMPDIVTLTFAYTFFTFFRTGGALALCFYCFAGVLCVLLLRAVVVLVCLPTWNERMCWLWAWKCLATLQKLGQLCSRNCS
jgi:hypothetical protein